MFALVDIHDEVIIVVTLDGRFFGQRRLVWLFGLTGVPLGAPAFFAPQPLLAGGGAVQTVPERGPFVIIRECLNQNGFRAESVTAVQCVVKFPREARGGVRQAMPTLAWPSGGGSCAGDDVGRYVRLAERRVQVALH